MSHVTVVLATVLVLGACVLLQYEGLVLIWRLLSTHTGHRRVKVLYGIFSVLVLHVVQIAIFAVALWLLLRWPGNGKLAGRETADLFECLYLSAVSFSTVGFGDVAPLGAIRFLAAAEALSGFVLITWSAAFTYLEMARFWRIEEMQRKE